MTPMLKEGSGWDFYGKPDSKAVIFALPYEPAAERTRRGVRPVALHRPGAGALALGFHDPAGTRNCTRPFPTRSSSCIPRMPSKTARLRRGDEVKVISRRGEILTRLETRGRNKPPVGPGIRALVRRQPADQQGDPGRHRPALQGNRLQEMRREGRSRPREDDDHETADTTVCLLGWLPASPWPRPTSPPCAAAPSTRSSKPPRIAKVDNNDIKRKRAYPMQPPTIPHKIRRITRWTST